VKNEKGVDVSIPGDISSYDVVVRESVDKICDNLVEMEVFNEGVILHQVIFIPNIIINIILIQSYFKYRLNKDIIMVLFILSWEIF
jgi:hypothetical protein